MIKTLTIFTGNSNRELAESICRYVEIPLGRAEVTKFSDGESYVEIGESVRGVTCFVIQSTCPPVNHNLMELLIMIDALKRASAGGIVVVLPYFGYARQDRKVRPRTPISAKLAADLITAAGAERVLAVDLHAGQIQGFFNIPFDHMYAMPVFIDHVRGRYPDNAVVVSPDAGGVERARAYSKRLNATLAIIDKRRERANVSEDDLIDTAGTLTHAAKAIMAEGARSVSACATHGVLSGSAIQRIEESPLTDIFITDTIPLTEAGKNCKKIKSLTVGRLLGEAVKRIHHGDSISSLFI